MMNMNKLAKEICKREGLKKQVDIAQVKEILGHVSDLMYETASPFLRDLPLPKKRSVLGSLFANGARRAKRKDKK